MDLQHVLRRLSRDKELSRYYPVCRSFAQYLVSTSRCSFRFIGARFDDEENTWKDVEQNAEYLHRYTVTYRRAVLSKFYQLEEWHNAHPGPITLMTLTTYHGINKYGQEAHSEAGKGITIEDSFNMLKSSWNSLRMSLRHYISDTPWVWIMEPHETGYPHLHVVIFADLDKGTQEAIKRLWSEKYQAGSFDRGIDFSCRKPDQAITSIRNYLMKYVAKGFTSTGSKFGEDDDWTPGQFVYYALTWKQGWRLFGASRELCKVMAYSKKTDERTEWYATQLLDMNGDTHTTWTAAGVRAGILDQEDLCQS